MRQGDLFNRADFIGNAFRLLDAFIVFFAGYFVHYLRFGEWLVRVDYQLFLIVVAFLTVTVFNWCSVYQAWRGQWLLKELGRVSAAWVVVVLAIGLLMFLSKTGGSFSRLWVGWSFLVIYLGMISVRAVSRFLLRFVRRRGLNQKNIVIVGAGALGKRACDAMLSESWAGLKPVAFFDDDMHNVGQRHKGVEVLGGIGDVVQYIEQYRLNDDGKAVDQVWVALPLSSEKRIEELQLALQDTATSVYFIPDLYGFNLANYKVDQMVGLPVMNMSATHMRGGSALVKRLEDLVISGLLLITLSPVFAVIAVLIKRESPGPVFFKQRRYGQDGKEILVWKFRSMTVTEDGVEIKQAQREDKRITKIGGWLRKLSLDELPQLVNVLQGTMSLVGPRPHAVAHNEFYRKKVQGYMMRHQIKPGITGWAQVNGSRGETSKLEDMEERIRYDLEYIRNWSIPLDIRILFKRYQLF